MKKPIIILSAIMLLGLLMSSKADRVEFGSLHMFKHQTQEEGYHYYFDFYVHPDVDQSHIIEMMIQDLEYRNKKLKAKKG